MTRESDAALESLVPKIAVELAAEAGNRHVSIDGSMLSADISGFTALSERLADKGKAGAEEITSLISRCFTALIDEAYTYGGEVLKFGGDALLVLFRGDDHELRVAAASVAMQDALAKSSAAKYARLTMTVGASEGPFDVFMVGSATRDLLISGDRASNVIELEGEAGKGETLISTAIAAVLPDSIERKSDPLGFVIDQVVDAPKPGPNTDAIDASAVDTLIAPSILEQFAAFDELGGEHRIVAVDFLKLDGVQAQLDANGGQATADALGHVFDEVHEIGQRFDVTILHTDISPDGVKFLLCAGAPHTTGQVSDAILEAALEIRDIDTPFVLKQGIQQGRCFAGFLGSQYRRAYTLMGDIVNTAARMLGPAHDGEIVAVDDVFTTTRTVFVTDPLAPVVAKGKTEPIAASLVVSTSESNKFTRQAAPLIGRDAQLAQLTDILEESGGIAQLVGPAGAGKSRLLDALTDEAFGRGRNVASGHCSPYSQASPYSALRVLLRKALNIDSFADIETVGDILVKMIRHFAPELEPMAPVIAIPVGAKVAATPEADAIDPKYLRSQINTHVRALLLAVLPPRSMIVIEDVHWIDDPSSEFFDHLLSSSNDGDWTTILTRRPEGDWQPEAGKQRFESVAVEPLTGGDIRELAIATSDEHLTDRQLDVVVEQAAGNPLFAIELAKAVGSQETVPDTVEQLIGARVDALAPNERHALRVASVFGYRLRRTSLKEIFAPRTLPPMRNLSEFVSVDSRGNMQFTHALYREVAYEGLPYAERKRLHRTVGEHLEASVDDPSTLADLLALHFSEAKDSARTWKYGVMAGDKAQQNAATAEAAINYGRAVRVAGRLRSIDAAELARVSLELGDSTSLLGRFEQAERAYASARRTTSDLEIELTAMLRVGRLRERRGRPTEARKWYERVRGVLASKPEQEYLSVRSEMHHQVAGLLHRRGDQQGCIIEARRALGTAEDSDSVDGMAEALIFLHLATVYLGRRDHIGYGPRALALFDELGNYARKSIVLNNLGIEKYFNDRWTEAADFYARSAEAGTKSGSLIEGMLGALNSGEILSDQGHWDSAIELLENARRNWEGGRYPTGLAIANLYLGIAHSRNGNDEVAEQLLLRAHETLDELGLQDQCLDALSHLYWHQAQTGAADREQIAAFIDKVGPDSGAGTRALQALGCAYALDGEWSVARTRMIDSLSSTTGYGRALTLRLLDHFDGEAADPSWSVEAQEIFDDLGVVRLRSLPDPPD